jgi:hypothetical protein
MRSPAVYTATTADSLHGQHVLHRDYETRSRAILKTVGAQRYAANSATEVLCCAYAVDDDPVQVWRPGDPVPIEFVLLMMMFWMMMRSWTKTTIKSCKAIPTYRSSVAPVMPSRSENG